MNGTQWADEAFARSSVIRGTIYQRGFDGKIRTRAAEVGPQLRGMPRGALGVAARGAGVASGALGVYDMYSGYSSGDEDTFFDGIAGVASFAVAFINPAAGIAIGVGAFTGAGIREDAQTRGGQTIAEVVSAAGPVDAGCH
jgi:hypothetical protein